MPREKIDDKNKIKKSVTMCSYGHYRIWLYYINKLDHVASKFDFYSGNDPNKPQKWFENYKNGFSKDMVTLIYHANFAQCIMAWWAHYG